MTMPAVAEVSAESTRSFEDAVNKCLDRAGRAFGEIEAVWIDDMRVVRRCGFSVFRVGMKLTRVVDRHAVTQTSLSTNVTFQNSSNMLA